MPYLLAAPYVMTAAAADAAQIGWAISQADLSAAGSTTAMATAAADEVSEAIATLFNAYAQGYQAVSRQAAAFHESFVQTLTAATGSYAQVEAAATQALLAPPPPVPVDAALILSESGVPTPPDAYIQAVYSKYVLPNFPSATPPQGVSSPNGLYPFTGVKDLTLDVSLARGKTILFDAIQAQLATLPPGGSMAVLGYSQSAVLSSLVMPMLSAAGVPSSQVNFVLLGNPMNPNGGVFARFGGLTLPSLGFTFYGATPDNLYPTVNYTLEYDGFADFPRYPLNLLADINAVMGIALVHGNYQGLTQAQIDSAILLPTEGPTQSTYYMIPTENLPLLQPLRMLPYVGNPVAELLEPNMRVLVNLGYGDPAYGYDTGPANVPTRFGFLPPVSPLTVMDHLVVGTQQGFVNAGAELQAQGPPRLPDLSGVPDTLRSNLAALQTGSSPSSVFVDLLRDLQSTNSGISNRFVKSFSTAYGTLLPTADILSEVAFTLPTYDLNLFIDGMIQVADGQPVEGLINAIGNPLAANIGLVSLASGFQLIVWAYALDTILTGNPHPML